MDSDTNTATDLIHELQRRIGRNLLRFQQIELRLKFILPYIHPAGSKAGIDAFRAYRDSVGEKTLGLLVGDLEKSMRVEPGFFDKSLSEVVDARNYLVHHLLGTHGESLATAAGIQSVLTRLDSQYNEAEELASFVGYQYLAGLLSVLEAHEKYEPDFALLRSQLIERLPASFEWVDQGDPTKTIWRTTRIVRLLKMAESNTPQVDGMTLLANAGQYIRREAPDLVYEEYGLTKLKEILEASTLFDVDERLGIDPNASTVLYKSKPTV